MKTKTFSHGKYSCKSYMKRVGNGWETGLMFKTKTIFVGNFIHKKEAMQWFARMNWETQTFAKKYTVGYGYPTTWFMHFLGNHMYKCYYTFLDKVFVQHNTTFRRAVTRDIRTYQRLKKHWYPSERTVFYKAA